MGARGSEKGMVSPSLVAVASFGSVLGSTLFAAADGSPALVAVAPVTGSPVSAVVAAADGSPALVAVAADAGSLVDAGASPYPVGVRVESLW